jgi:hypothetical protein
LTRDLPGVVFTQPGGRAPVLAKQWPGRQERLAGKLELAESGQPFPHEEAPAARLRVAGELAHRVNQGAGHAELLAA